MIDTKQVKRNINQKMVVDIYKMISNNLIKKTSERLRKTNGPNCTKKCSHDKLQLLWFSS